MSCNCCVELLLLKLQPRLDAIDTQLDAIKKQLGDSVVSAEMFEKLRIVADSQDALENKIKEVITPSQPST